MELDGVVLREQSLLVNLPPSWETDKNCVMDTLLVPKSAEDKPKGSCSIKCAM